MGPKRDKMDRQIIKWYPLSLSVIKIEISPFPDIWKVGFTI